MRRVCQLLVCACASIGLAVALAAVDLDRILSLAQERYGGRGTEVMKQWSRLVQESRGQGDNELLNSVNNFVNRRISYTADIEAFGEVDYWATPLESLGGGRGDCEDFVIAKYITLLQMGVANDKLRLIYVNVRNGGAGAAPGGAHMVLGYYASPEGEPLILDNLISSVRSASARKDLTPVYTFNSDGLWVGGVAGSQGDPTAKLSKWRDVQERMRQEGWSVNANASHATSPPRTTP